MPTVRSLLMQSLCKDGWQEFKTVVLVFLGIVFPAAILLMTPLPKPAVLWSTFVAVIMIPPLVLHWKERRKKRYDEVKSSESIALLLHGQAISNYIHVAREDSQPLENLRQFLAVSSRGNAIPFLPYRIKNTEATLAARPPMGFNEVIQRISGKVSFAENIDILEVVSKGALSDSENMTASAQIPAQRFLEAISLPITGIMRAPILPVAD